jgi:hypothetical protein
VSARVVRDLDRFYASLQSRWPVSQRADYAGLVVPNGNGSSPVHRWFRMKEAYSCELVGSVLKATCLEHTASLSVCDPLCGSGTTGVSIAQAVAAGELDSASFTGLESNPYLHLLARTKLAAMRAPPAGFSALAQRVAATVARRAVEPAAVPPLSTFSESRYFSKDALCELLRLRAAISAERREGADALDVDLAMVCLGSIAESVSKLRRDGRALRYEPDKPTIRPLSAFLEKAAEVEEDLPAAPVPVRADVHKLDTRIATHTLTDAGPFDLIVFSPPYPNNIDYTEVYKLEGWLLGYYTDQSAFAAQRWRTVRSHASLDFGDDAIGLGDGLREAAAALSDPLIRAAAEGGGRYAAARQRTIRGYVYDMLEMLVILNRASAEDSHLVYVVGNSMHGGRGDEGIVIAADLLIARLAELAGFTITNLAVARIPVRRRTSSEYLRESIVFARNSRYQGAAARVTV